MVRFYVTNGIISVESPYNTKFIAEAKRLNGKWDSENRSWNFPAESRSRLTKTLKSIFDFDIPAKDIPKPNPVWNCEEDVEGGDFGEERSWEPCE